MIEVRTLSGKNPRLKINLFKMFGARVPDSKLFRESVGQEIIDAIREQALSGRDKNGKLFKGRAARYSKSYAESIAFKSAGKSKGNVNLKLTGEMLGFMDIIDQGRNFITIGFASRQDQLKAHGHILGSSPGPRVKRDFFGLPDKAYKKIASGFNIKEQVKVDDKKLLRGLVLFRELFGGS